jgi:hypothetical protein
VSTPSTLCRRGASGAGAHQRAQALGLEGEPGHRADGLDGGGVVVEGGVVLQRRAAREGRDRARQAGGGGPPVGVDPRRPARVAEQ